jgi:hypothetical protein
MTQAEVEILQYLCEYEVTTLTITMTSNKNCLVDDMTWDGSHSVPYRHNLVIN